jgi:hypothetical protein
MVMHEYYIYDAATNKKRKCWISVDAHGITITVEGVEDDIVIDLNDDLLHVFQYDDHGKGAKLATFPADIG